MNLTIEQKHEILKRAPEGRDTYCRATDAYFKQMKIMKCCAHCVDLNILRSDTADHATQPCQHGYDVACLICNFGTVDGKRVWHNKSELKKGDRVKVDFIGESATIYSGKRFTGYGVLDRVEDGRVFGRLDDGTPFMCLCADVEVVEG